MNKRKLYAMTTCLLALSIVIEGWFLTEALLGQKREEFLARTGQIALRSSETALLATDEAGDADDNGAKDATFEGESLSEEMMAKVLTAWEGGGTVLPHEPKKGQMSMEQAIDAGKDWIKVMAGCGVVPQELAECDFDHVTASLCTFDVQVDFDESLLSCWTVQFTKNDFAASLTVHAASGEIWKANLSMKESDSLPARGYSYEELLETAFPFLGEENKEIITFIDDTSGVVNNADYAYQIAGDIYEMNNAIGEIMPERLVYAAVKEQQFLVDAGETFRVIGFWLSTVYQLELYQENR